MYYLNMFLALSFQIHLYTGIHNHHSCFYTLKTSGRNKFLPRIRQYLRQNFAVQSFFNVFVFSVCMFLFSK